MPSRSPLPGSPNRLKRLLLGVALLACVIGTSTPVLADPSPLEPRTVPSPRALAAAAALAPAPVDSVTLERESEIRLEASMRRSPLRGARELELIPQDDGSYRFEKGRTIRATIFRDGRVHFDGRADARLYLGRLPSDAPPGPVRNGIELQRAYPMYTDDPGPLWRDP